MATHPRGRVCVLSSIELADWKTRNIKPDCNDHDHVSEEDAKQLAWPDWMMKEKVFFDRAAEFVGPNHIMIYSSVVWQGRPLRAGLRMSTMQLVPGVVGGGRHATRLRHQSTNGFPARMNLFKERQAAEEKLRAGELCSPTSVAKL